MNVKENTQKKTKQLKERIKTKEKTMSENKMRVINLFGAPGSGKSTAMHGLVHKMKMLGLSVEEASEFYKEIVMEDGTNNKFGGQLYVLGEQNRRLARLEDKNDFAITDCPLPLISFYSPQNYVQGFEEFCINLFNNYENHNYFLTINHPFESEKRIHKEEEAKNLEKEIPKFLKKHNIPFTHLTTTLDDVVASIMKDMAMKNIIGQEHLKKSRNPEVRRKMSI